MTAAVSSLARWVDLIEVVAWPFVALMAVFALAFSRKVHTLLVKLLSRFRRVTFFGVEIEVSEGAADKIRGITDEAFRLYRRKVQSEFDRESRGEGLREKSGRVAKDHIEPLLRSGTYRCTIHVADILFAETLYQLLDYYPHGAGRGRTFSTRFGIVGKAWRSGAAEISGDVTTNPDQLIRDWGMTSEEAAAAGQKHRSFAAVPLRDEEDESLVGVFFVDAQEKDAFGDGEEADRAFAKAVVDGCKKTGLTKSLAKIVNELRRKGPDIRVHEI